MDAAEALAALGIHLREWRAGQHYLKCPWCTGRSRTSLSVLVKPDGHALYCCNRCEASGSTHKLIREHERLVRDAARHAKPIQKPVPPQVEPRVPLQGGPAQPVTWHSEHDEFWDRCATIRSSDPAGAYLRSRCCPIPHADADLRWIPELRRRGRSVAEDDPERWNPSHGSRPGDHCGPALVARITSAETGEPTSFHFTWLAADGSGKAALQRPRLLAKGMTKLGGVIRLTDPADTTTWLVVGEGIETVLSSLGEWRDRHGWAAIDAGNMAALPVPPWLDDVVILVDHDRPNPRTGKRAGPDAADELARRCDKVALHVAVIMPERLGDDWNDVVTARHAQQAQHA